MYCCIVLFANLKQFPDITNRKNKKKANYKLSLNHIGFNIFGNKTSRSIYHFDLPYREAGTEKQWYAV